MPEISRFYGLVVFMNYNDHNPPHFHARYQDQEVVIEIETGIVQGKMAQRALELLFEWYRIHKKDLLDDWKLSRDRKPLKKITPLQ